MTTPDIEGLDQLERAVLDEDASLATALRRFLLIAGYAHQEELRAWALKQLDGYEVGEELPRFREVAAALEITVEPSTPGRARMEDTRQISPYQLPQSVRDRGIGEHAPIRYGIREIEALIAMGWNLELSPPGSAEYMAEVTNELGNGSTVLSLHWRVRLTALRGVLDHIRTRLALFVAEVRAAMPPGQRNPNPDQIDSAAQHAFSITGGDGTTINIVAPSAKAARGSTASATVNEPVPSPPQPWWHRSSVIWSAIAATATIAGVIATVAVAK
ncbi:AbiTii domain-containing protein [Streptomyces inhibens]|uniref:AbiTii domain-containing protein n=1 Tax=Streptomyces inhibens TaxID=2293571 RepID=UPI00402ADFB6